MNISKLNSLSKPYKLQPHGLFDSIIGNTVGSLANNVFGSLFGSKDAKVAAEAAAQDQRQTSVDSTIQQQLMQALSQLDKSVVEKLASSTNTADFMNQLQSALTQQQTSEQQQTTGQQQTAEQQQQQQTTTRGGAETNQALQSALNQISGQFSGGGQDSFNAAVQQVLRSGAPALYGVGNRAGTFGDTTTALLQNDLTTRAAEAGVLAQNQQQNNLVSQLSQLAQSLQAGTETTTGQATSTGSTATTGTANTTGSSATTSQNQTAQTGGSQSTTTQDRTANESSTESTNQATSSAGSQTSDTFIDFGKDAGWNKDKILQQLGTAVQPGLQNTPAVGPINPNPGTIVSPGDPTTPQRPAQAVVNPMLAKVASQLPTMGAADVGVTTGNAAQQVIDASVMQPIQTQLAARSAQPQQQQPIAGTVQGGIQSPEEELLRRLVGKLPNQNITM